jgi:hypothetical protein
MYEKNMIKTSFPVFMETVEKVSLGNVRACFFTNHNSIKNNSIKFFTNYNSIIVQSYNTQGGKVRITILQKISHVVIRLLDCYKCLTVML